MELDIKTSIEGLIKEIRQNIPFNFPMTGFCQGKCDVCPEKLIEFLDIEVSHWESRLKAGVLPKPEEIDLLSKDYKKVYQTLFKYGHIAHIPQESIC